MQKWKKENDDQSNNIQISQLNLFKIDREREQGTFHDFGVEQRKISKISQKSRDTKASTNEWKNEKKGGLRINE